MPLDPARTVAELRELRELTGDENGAQRVAWTDTWARAREWLAASSRGCPSSTRSTRPETSGGRFAANPSAPSSSAATSTPCRTAAGSTAASTSSPRSRCCAGSRRKEPRPSRSGSSTGPTRRARASAAHSSAPRRRRARWPTRTTYAAAGPRRRSRSRMRCASTASSSTARSRRARQLEGAAAYLELHIEQGRCSSRWISRSAPCSAPSASSATGSPGRARPRMPARPRWTSAATRSRARRSSRSSCGRSRSGSAAAPSSRRQRRLQAGIVTSVVETAEQLLDMRHLDAESSPRCGRGARGGERFAERSRSTSSTSGSGDPADPLRRDARSASRTRPSARSRDVAQLPSGPLHDAAEVSRAGVPTVMLFVQSLRGLSHTKLEDTKPEHLELAVQALDRLADEDDRLGRVRLSAAAFAAAPSSSTATASCSRRRAAGRSPRRSCSLATARSLATTRNGPDRHLGLRRLARPSGCSSSRVAQSHSAGAPRARRAAATRGAAAFPSGGACAGVEKACPDRVASNTPQRLVRGALACAGLESTSTWSSRPTRSPSPSRRRLYLARRSFSVQRRRGRSARGLSDGRRRRARRGLFVIGNPRFRESCSTKPTSSVRRWTILASEQRSASTRLRPWIQ